MASALVGDNGGAKEEARRENGIATDIDILQSSSDDEDDDSDSESVLLDILNAEEEDGFQSDGDFQWRLWLTYRG